MGVSLKVANSQIPFGGWQCGNGRVNVLAKQ